MLLQFGRSDIWQATIRLQARRFRNQLSPTGQVQRSYTGDTLDLASLQLYISAPGPGQNYRSYFYSRYPPSPYNSVEEADAARVANDWNVSQVKGRWELRVHPDDGPSNTVDVKIDKRGQVTGAAIAWANYYQYKQANADSQAELDEWSSINHPDGLWDYCFSFANYVYDQHGLEGLGTTGPAAFGAASALDDGPGSLRFYWSKIPVPTAPNDPGHIGIIGPNTLLGYGTRIDNNGKPDRLTYGLSIDGVLNPQRFNGPLWRAKDEGVGDAYFSAAQNAARKPISKTLPASRGGTMPNGNLKSLLQELDEE